MVSKLRPLGAGFSGRRLGFSSGSFYVRFLMNEMALEKNSSQIPSGFPLLIIIPLFLHIRDRQLRYVTSLNMQNIPQPRTLNLSLHLLPGIWMVTE
jgi:hypothetical protein